MRIDLASGSGKDNDRGGGFRDRYSTVLGSEQVMFHDSADREDDPVAATTVQYRYG
jgi:hypothetical protein